jgi:hypothetical protein
MKKILAITIMAMVLGLGTPAAFAGDGTAESPGITSQQTTDQPVYTDGTAESPGYTGTAESPGFLATVSFYLDVLV